jgi:hypothetical protein
MDVSGAALPPNGLQARKKRARENDFHEPIQIARVDHPSEPNISLPFFRNVWFSLRIPHSIRGALRDRHECSVRDAMDVQAA